MKWKVGKTVLYMLQLIFYLRYFFFVSTWFSILYRTQKQKKNKNYLRLKKINYNIYIKVQLNLDINGWYTDCFCDK